MGSRTPGDDRNVVVGEQGRYTPRWRGKRARRMYMRVEPFYRWRLSLAASAALGVALRARGAFAHVQSRSKRCPHVSDSGGWAGKSNRTTASSWPTALPRGMAGSLKRSVTTSPSRSRRVSSSISSASTTGWRRVPRRPTRFARSSRRRGRVVMIGWPWARRTPRLRRRSGGSRGGRGEGGEGGGRGRGRGGCRGRGGGGGGRRSRARAHRGCRGGRGRFGRRVRRGEDRVSFRP